MRQHLLISLLAIHLTAAADDSAAIRQAALDYIESQHAVNPPQMARALDEQLVKRTYWRNAQGEEFILQTDREGMLKVAATYNRDGTRFPDHPRKDVVVLDIDQRVASVKLVADEWIDYMHLYKNAAGEWKVLNVLWQYHDTERQRSKK